MPSLQVGQTKPTARAQEIGRVIADALIDYLALD